jgi:seryl-tRNA synthetase
MLDPAFIRANRELVAQKLHSRKTGSEATLNEFERIDSERRQSLAIVEKLRADMNASSKRVEAEISPLLIELRKIESQLKNIANKASGVTEDDRKEHPVISVLAELGGALAPAILIPKKIDLEQKILALQQSMSQQLREDKKILSEA